jgi:hypothetical protein
VNFFHDFYPKYGLSSRLAREVESRDEIVPATLYELVMGWTTSDE